MEQFIFSRNCLIYFIHWYLVILVSEYEPIVVPPAPEEASSFDSNGPRLIISHIVNENFKSYAGTQTLGPFHKVNISVFILFMVL